MDICLSHISKAFQGKPVIKDFSLTIESGSFTTEMGKRLPQRSPAPLAMLLASVLVTICLLLWMVQNAITTCKSHSLVGGNSKRVTLTPLSSSCMGADSRRVISPSLTTPNFSVRRRIAKTRKESQDPRNRKSSLGNAPGIVLVIGIMLFGGDICSLFPLYSTMAILVITYVILTLPYTAEYITSA